MRRLTVVAALAGLLFAPAGAQAGLVLSLDDGAGNSVMIGDNMAGDSNATLGAVTFVGSLGTWVVNVTTGISKPVIGPPPTLDLNSVNASGGTGTLLIAVTDTDYTGYSGLQTFNSDIGGTTDGTVTFASFFDPANAEFGLSVLAAFDTFASSPFSGGYHFSGLTADPFSMTLVTYITHGGAGDITSYNALMRVPEPGTMLLVGLGFLTLGLTRRRVR